MTMRQAYGVTASLTAKSVTLSHVWVDETTGEQYLIYSIALDTKTALQVIENLTNAVNYVIDNDMKKN